MLFRSTPPYPGRAGPGRAPQDGSVVIDTGRADWASAEGGADPRRGARRVLSPAALGIAYLLMVREREGGTERERERNREREREE